MNIAIIGASSEASYPLKLIKKWGGGSHAISAKTSARIPRKISGRISAKISPKGLPKKSPCVSFAFDGDANAKALKHADNKIICDISDKNTLIAKLKECKIDAILPVPVGRVIENIGYANEVLGLKGIKHRPALLSADKYEFARLFEKTRCANTKLLNADEIQQILSQKHLEKPKIIKPRFGSGSKDVFFITSFDELKIAFDFSQKSKDEFIIEDFIFGDEYGADATFVDGKFELILLRKKLNQALPNRQSVAYIAINDKGLYEQVSQALCAACVKLGYKECIINADIIINDNEIFIIEIAPRPSGHYIQSALIPLACGFSVYDEYLKFLCGSSCDFAPKKREEIMLGFFDINGQITRLPSKAKLDELGVIKYYCNLKKNDILAKAKDGRSLVPRGYFVLGGGDLEEKRESLLSEFFN